jgi:uncharacterized membrane protein YqgA involved in biofilm formation
MIETILSDNWLAALVILVTQIGFLYFRTLNIIYTAEMRMVPAVISNLAIGVCWLLSTAISLNSVMTGHIIPVIAFLLGGCVGTYWAIKGEIKKHKKSLEDKK